MPKFSTIVMCWNDSHNGPASFTALQADDIEIESYNNTQMTKEKLFLQLLHTVHWQTIVNHYKSA